MTEQIQESPIREQPILIPESLEILKGKMTVNPYTDKQLNRTAMFFVAPTLSLASELGAADDSPTATFTTANLFARTIMADFINSGLIAVSAIDRYLDRAEQMILDEEREAKAKADREDATDGSVD